MSSPAGWYPQPDGQQRYWDGEQWTDNFAPGAASVPSGTQARDKQARKNWLLRHKVLTAIGAVLLLAAFTSIANGSDTKSTTTASVAEPVGVSTTPDQAALDQAAADKASAEKTAADKVAADQAAADKVANDQAAADKVVADKKAAADKVVADKAAAVKAAAEKAAAAKKAVAARVAAAKKAAAARVAAANRLTTAQENAKRKAESYLEFTGFSRSGLITQLKFEGFSAKDAERAIHSMKVNWNTEAAQKAKSYVDMSGFSRSGLINQLRFEGFTRAQAAHGADSVGL
jgi:hypothetical protein